MSERERYVNELHENGTGYLAGYAMADRLKDLHAFTDAYIECALWSSTDWSRDDGGDALDDNYSDDDLAPETLKEIRQDCSDFLTHHEELIGSEASQAGHDFWLTRNGHGCGFWDGDWPEPAATQLTEASKVYGGVDLCVGDDGRIYS